MSGQDIIRTKEYPQSPVVITSGINTGDAATHDAKATNDRHCQFCWHRFKILNLSSKKVSRREYGKRPLEVPALAVVAAQTMENGTAEATPVVIAAVNTTGGRLRSPM